MMSQYHVAMTRQTTVRLPDDLADVVNAVARVHGASVNQLIIDSLTAEIDRVRPNEKFRSRAARLLKRDAEILERLAQ